MKLDRNINPNGMGKYALLKLRRQSTPIDHNAMQCAKTLKDAGLLDFGDTPDSDFFVIRLKDKYAAPALKAYAEAARADGHIQWSEEIMELAVRADMNPNKHQPD